MFKVLKSLLIPKEYLGKPSLRCFAVSRCKEKKVRALYEEVYPWERSEREVIGSDILKPCYWDSGVPEKSPPFIEIKNEEQIMAIKRACKLASKILKSLENIVKAGMTTDEIDKYVHKLCLKSGAYPSPLNYHNYPKSICTSVNNVACHGVPDFRPLKNGDILNIDITVYLNYMHGDCSAMFCVGDVDEDGLDLCLTTREALLAGISVCKPGKPFSDIGKIIQEVAEKKNYRIVPAFLGHGIGSYFHGLPDIYHFDTANSDYDNGLKMEPGMTFTIEPVLSEGGHEVTILEDGWTAVTNDGSRTAQWEHTVLITDCGVEILTSCEG